MLRGIRTLVASGLCSALIAGTAQTQNFSGPCVVVDNGSGTVDLPPDGCGYLSPMAFHEIVAGLPIGTTINMAPEHALFLCGPAGCETSGGPLGGTIDMFDSNLRLVLTGTGTLAGFNRIINVPVQCEVHTAPRTPGMAVQTFATEMFDLQGGISGDLDFQNLTVRAGFNQTGVVSPGSTTLFQQPNGDFVVDSFFDITYQIDYIGAPGGALAGLSGLGGPTLVTVEAFGIPDIVPVLPVWGFWAMAIGMLAVGLVAISHRRRRAAAGA